MASKKRGYFKNLMGSLDSAYQHEKKIKDEFTKSAKGYLKNLTGQDVSDDDIKIMEYIKKGLITSSLPPVLRNMYGLKDFYSNIRKIMDAAKGQTQYADPSNKNQGQTGGLTNSTIDNTSQEQNVKGSHNNSAGIGNNTSGFGKYSSRLLSAPVSAIGNQLITGVGGDGSTQGGSGQGQGGDVPDPLDGGFVGPGGSFPGGTSGSGSGESSGEGGSEEKTSNTSENVGSTSGTGATGDNGSVEDEKKYDTRAEIMTYEKYVKDLQEGIVEKYKSDVEYAGKSRDYAYTQADDAYRVAMREADRGFETSQPTYGATAEGLLGAGLAGSGYSDYLAGKAYDARSEERAAARSQMNAMKFAADRDYNESMKEAADNKFYNESNITSSKMEYAQKLKDTFDDRYAVMLENVLNGYYNASTAESILKQYTSDGVISDNVISALKNAEKEFLATNKESLIGQYINFISGLDDKSVVTENHMRMWLAENAKGALSENEIDVLVDGCFTNGKFDPDAAAKLEYGGVQAPEEGGGEKPPVDGGENTPEDGGNEKPDEDNTGDSDNKGEGEKDAETNKNDRPWYEWLLAPLALPALGIKAIKDLFKGKETTEAPVDADYWETLDIFKNAMNAHDIGNGEEYESILKDMEKYAEQGKVNPIAAGAINKMVNGLVVSSGTFKANNGLRAKFQEGDNFTVTINEKTYRVESEGPASEEVVAAAKNIFGVPAHVGIKSLKEGTVFGYKSDLYLVAYDNVYKIKARNLVGNGDYDKLWKAVYNEAISSLYSRAPTSDENAANSGKGKYTPNTQYVDMFHQMGVHSPQLETEVNSMKGALTDKYETNEGANTYTRNLFGDMKEGFVTEEDKPISTAPTNLENKLTPTEMTDGAGKHDFESADLAKGAIFKMKNNEGEYSFVSKGIVEDEAIANAVKAAAGDNSGIFWDADNKVMYACVKMSDGSQAVVELQNKKAAGKGNGEIVKDRGKFFDMLYDSYTESQQAEQEQNQQMDQAQKDGLKKAWNAVLNFFKERENEKIQQDHQFIDPSYGTGGVTDIPDMGIGNIISGSTSGGGNVGQGSGNVPSDGGGSWETPDYDYSKITKIGGNFAAEKGGFLSAEKNADSDLKELKNGDNITVEYDGEKYYVDIKSKITSREHDANKAADQLDIKPGQLFTLSTDKNNVYLRSGDGHIYSLTKRGGATFHGNSFDKLRTAISESTSAGNAENEAPVEKTLTYSDANFHKHVGWGDDPGLDKGDNFTIELNGKLYKVENGGEVKADDPVIEAAAGIYNGEVFAYGDQAYVKRNGKIYEIDTRFFYPKQEEKLVEAIKGNGGRGFDDQTNAKTYDAKVDGFTQVSYNPGDYLKIKDGFGKNRIVEIAAVITDGPIAKATYNKDIHVAQVFKFGDNYYVKRGEGMAFKIREGRIDFDVLKNHLDTFDSAANVSYSANFYAPPVIYGEINNMGQKNHYNVYEGEVGKKRNEIMIPFGDETYIAKVGDRVDSAHRLHDIIAAEGIEYSDEQLPVFVWNGNVYMLYGKKKIVELDFDHSGDKATVIAIIEGVVKQDKADAESESKEK